MSKTIKTAFAMLQSEQTLKIYIYSNVESDYYSWLTDEIVKSETSARSIAEKIEEAGDVKEIEVYINSNGGDVSEGLAIYSQLQRSSARVTAYIDGWAASIASVIAVAADKVVMNETAQMMIHKPWTVAAGNADELRKIADDLDKIAQSIRTAYLSKSGDKLDEKALDKMLEDETWLTAEECLGFGLCDEIEKRKDKIKEKAEKEIEDAKEQIVNSTLRAKLSEMFKNIT